MSLYFVHHKHDEKTCPAKDPMRGNMLLEHLNPVNANQFGVTIHGDAVLDNQHTFVLILEAEDVASIENFMTPFKQAGSLDIYPASTCENVVDREGC